MSIAPSDRIRASLIASAVGDALGAPTEFMSRAQIDARFGADGVREFIEPDGGAITDDTQMLLFTAEAMVRAHAHYRTTGSLDAVRPCAFQAYVRWLQTQGELKPPATRASPPSWIPTHPARATTSSTTPKAAAP